jgi:uncharacterized protein
MRVESEKIPPENFKPNQSMGEEQVLDILRKEKPYLQKNLELLAIALFGSYAKGTQQPESDIDLLVELSKPCFDFLAGLQIHLESRFGRPVEVIRKRKGSPFSMQFQ